MHIRREARKQEVRARLMEAALTLFRDQGVDETTVQSIVDRAGTSKGTFFNYFATKEHVLAAYYEQLVEAALTRAAPPRSDASAERRVIALLLACAATLDDVVLARAMLRALFSSAVIARADDVAESQLHDVVRTILREGIARGELRPDLELDVFCSLLTGALSASVQDWVLQNGRHDLAAALTAKLALLFRAARATKPVSRAISLRPKTAR